MSPPGGVAGESASTRTGMGLPCTVNRWVRTEYPVVTNSGVVTS